MEVGSEPRFVGDKKILSTTTILSSEPGLVIFPSFFLASKALPRSENLQTFSGLPWLGTLRAALTVLRNK